MRRFPATSTSPRPTNDVAVSLTREPRPADLPHPAIPGYLWQAKAGTPGPAPAVEGFVRPGMSPCGEPDPTRTWTLGPGAQGWYITLSLGSTIDGAETLTTTTVRDVPAARWSAMGAGSSCGPATASHRRSLMGPVAFTESTSCGGGRWTSLYAVRDGYTSAVVGGRRFAVRNNVLAVTGKARSSRLPGMPEGMTLTGPAGTVRVDPWGNPVPANKTPTR